MNSIKIKTPTAEISRRIQNKLFSQDIFWEGGRSLSYREDLEYIVVTSSGGITSGTDFSKHDSVEMSWQEFLYGPGEFYVGDLTNRTGQYLYYLVSDSSVCISLRSDVLMTLVNEKSNSIRDCTWMHQCDMHGTRLDTPKIFTKSDLVPGKHTVKLNDGLYHVLSHGVLMKIGSASNSWCYLNHYDENLIPLDSYINVSPVLEIHTYEPIDARNNESFAFTDEFKTSVYVVKQPPVPVTMQEICELFGYEVFIKEEK